MPSKSARVMTTRHASPATSESVVTGDRMESGCDCATKTIFKRRQQDPPMMMHAVVATRGVSYSIVFFTMDGTNPIADPIPNP